MEEYSLIVGGSLVNFTQLSLGRTALLPEFSGFVLHFVLWKCILDGYFFQHFGRKLQLEKIWIFFDCYWPTWGQDYLSGRRGGGCEGSIEFSMSKTTYIALVFKVI